jgi:hypothetical protein
VVAVGDRIYVRLSPAHIGYARVRELESKWLFYYDVEPPLKGAGLWAAGVLTLAGEGQVWCHDDPEEIAALNVVEALR